MKTTAQQQPALAAAAAALTLLLPLLLLLAAAPPAGAVTVTPADAPSVSVPLEAGVIAWMSQNVPPGTPAPDKYTWPFNSPPFIPWTDDRIRKTVPGCAPEQVHLGYWSEPSHVAEAGGALSVLVSWTTCDSRFGVNVTEGALPLDNARSEVWTRPAGGGGGGNATYARKFTGVHTSYTNAFEDRAAKTPLVRYSSPIVHHVLVKGLRPGERVDYAIPNWPQLAPAAPLPPAAGSAGPAGGARRLAQRADATAAADPAAAGGGGAFPAGTFYGSFVAPKSTFPFKIAVAGDAAQMETNGTVAQQNLAAMRPDLLLLLGDNAYHDDTGTKEDAAGKVVDEFPNFMQPGHLQFSDMVKFYTPRWESWHRFYAPLLSRYPTIETPGNHELNPEPFVGEGKSATTRRFLSRFKDYNAYWPSPQYPGLTRDGPTAETLLPVGPAEAPSPQTGMQNRNQYHAHAIPGVGTVVSLSNYILWEDYGAAQLAWLEETLAAIDRKKNPWLIVMWHAGWYTSLTKHYKETECMRRAYEPTFRRFGVDLVFNGHSHAYERMRPMFGWRTDATGCGAMHVTLGGSTADDLTFGYLDEERMTPYLEKRPKYCPCKKGVALTAQGECPSPDPTNGGKPKTPCPFAFCNVNPAKNFLIKAYQPPLTADAKYGLAPACALPNDEFPDPLCPAPGVQPAWSAFRKSTFGVGSLELLSPTQARWSWYESNLNLKGPVKAQDSVIIARDPAQKCSPPASAAAAAPRASSPAAAAAPRAAAAPPPPPAAAAAAAAAAASQAPKAPVAPQMTPVAVGK